MKSYDRFAIAAVMMIATMAVSCMLSSCEGRKMSNMQPKGETVEVVINEVDNDGAPQDAPTPDQQ